MATTVDFQEDSRLVLRTPSSKERNHHRKSALHVQRSESAIGMQDLCATDSEGSSSVDAVTKCAVSFGMVQVKEHAVILGDNPSTTCGPSVELDWASQTSRTYGSVEEFELHRSSSIRRNEKELVLSSRERIKLLLDNGFTFREIREETAKRKKKVQALSRKQVANVLKRFSNWKNDRIKQKDKRVQDILSKLD